jgi:hypothetical protein
MSVTQIIDSQFDRVTIRNYEQPLIWDRCGASVWNTPRFWAFKFGPNITQQAGSGTASPGADGTKFHGGEILGPTTGSGNYNYTIDAGDIEMDHMEWEVEASGGAAAAFNHITANGTRFQDIGSYFSVGTGGVNPTNSMVWDNNYVAPKFIGTILTVAQNAASVGTPNAGVVGNRGECIGCSGPLLNIFLTMGTAKGIAYGQDASQLFRVAADAFSYQGVGNVIAMSADGSNGFKPLTTTVGGLPPAAAGNKGYQQTVTDSTAIATEGQTCVGGSGNAALAFSNGTVWKCF